MDKDEKMQREFTRHVRAAKDKIIPAYATWHAGDFNGAIRIVNEVVGTTYFEILCTFIAMAEISASAAGVPTPDELAPGTEIAVRFSVANLEGESLDVEDQPREHAWAARFIAAVWASDNDTLSALYRVFTQDMHGDERGLAARALFSATAQIMQNARTQGRTGWTA